MKVIDANLLLYAVNMDAPLHDAARRWLEASLAGGEPVGFSWAVLLAFLRISTKPAVFPQPRNESQALDLTGAWLAQPCSSIIHPGERHHAILHSLLDQFGTGGNLTSDAHLAALAIEHGAELCSCDSDFSRFPGLRWRNPLR